MSHRTLRHSHPLRGGMIMSGTEEPLSANAGGSGTGTGSPTDHTHPNITLLNSLNFDSEQRLRSDTNVINPPLEQKDW